MIENLSQFEDDSELSRIEIPANLFTPEFENFIPPWPDTEDNAAKTYGWYAFQNYMNGKPYNV